MTKIIFYIWFGFLINCSFRVRSTFLNKLQTHKGQRELAPHCLEISCVNQVGDGRIRSRVTLGGVSNSICTSSLKVPPCLSCQVSELTFCRVQTSDLVGGEGPKHQSLGLCRHWTNTVPNSTPPKRKWTPLVHALTCTSHDKRLVWVWDSADVCQ